MKKGTTLLIMLFMCTLMGAAEWLGTLMSRYRDSDSNIMESRAKQLAMVGNFEDAFNYQKRALMHKDWADMSKWTLIRID